MRALTIGCTPALASAASGQWEFEFSNPVLSPSNPSTTVTLSLAPPPGDWGVAVVEWDTHADEAGWSSPETLLLHPGQHEGTIAESSVLGAVAAQGLLFSFPGEPGRVDVWRATFTVAEFTAREVDFWTDTVRFLVFPDFPAPSSPTVEPRVAVEGRATIQVIPSPGAAGLLGIGALAAARRRRDHARPQHPTDTILGGLR